MAPWNAVAATTAAILGLQQRLLGRAMRQLDDNAILPAGLLNRFLREPDVFRPTEAVELVIDPLSLVDFTSVWDKLKPRIQTSVAYVAKPILIDSDIKITEGPPVHTRVFDMAKVLSALDPRGCRSRRGHRRWPTVEDRCHAAGTARLVRRAAAAARVAGISGGQHARHRTPVRTDVVVGAEPDAEPARANAPNF